MDRATARHLLKFVNDPWVLEDLEVYVNSRIQSLYFEMEQSKDFHELLKLQGAVKELRRFKYLKDEVRGKADEKSNQKAD